MGEVYLAQDESLDRPVAIKFLILPGDEQGRQRLLREARAAAALDHPAICAVYEVGTDPVGGDFIVMQYVEGETLAARLKRGRIAPAEALGIATRMAEALKAAHARGIVHRDLKPQNVMLSPSGAPRLLDFGLARRIEPPTASADAETAPPITRPHVVIGTPGYMAPEQIRGLPVDARSDVFAFGCVLYECLTGRRAFSGSTPAEVHGQVLHVEPPAPSSLVLELGPAHDALCGRLLQKSAEDRLQSAEEILGALRAITGAPKTTETVARTGTSPRFAMSRRGAITATVLVAIGLVGFLGIWQWQHRNALPEPPANARVWYDRGVDALREGAFAGAKASFQEAIRHDDRYVQAYARLAEAESELDDESGAKDALIHVSDLVPDRTRLDPEDQLRLEAAQSSVLRKHDEAIRAYTQLAARRPKDAGTWIDLGRAEEAAGLLNDARATYEKALQLDSESAVAHLRLGAVRSLAGQPEPALASFNEAIRLSRAAVNPEGEAEALLRKGRAQSTVGQYGAARTTLEEALRVAVDPRYLSQRLRSQFELARVASFEGRLTEAEATADEAVARALESGLKSLAADGLIELANTRIQKRDFERAEATLTRAIDIAAGTGAVRTEMRARLQLASLRTAYQANPDSLSPQDALIRRSNDALAMTQAPLKFFAERHYVRLEVTARNIMSRAHEQLEHYEEANRLATEALTIEEAIGDQALVATSLETIATQLPKFGRLPEALAYRERIEKIHRDQHDQSALARDLSSRAQLLIELGRGPDAEQVLAEVEAGAGRHEEPFVSQTRRVAYLRALLAATQGRFADVGRFVATLAEPSAKPDSLVLWGQVLGEYARARLGTSRAAPAAIAGWPQGAGTPVSQRDLSYWAALTLLERREYSLAVTLATQAASSPPAEANPELHWRLMAIADKAGRRLTAGPANGASISARAATDVQQLVALWGGQATAYLARLDLAALR